MKASALQVRLTAAGWTLHTTSSSGEEGRRGGAKPEPPAGAALDLALTAPCTPLYLSPGPVLYLLPGYPFASAFPVVVQLSSF